MARSLRHIILWLLLALAVANLRAESPKYEFRGVWVATAYGIDWPSKAGTSSDIVKLQKRELDDLVSRVAALGFNAVMFQVRPMADALYISDLEPTSSFLTGARGKRPAYDPLAYMVAKCHEHGLECHAWVNPFRVGKEVPTTPIDRRRESLFMTNTVKKSKMTILNPGLEATRALICDVVCDIARRYDIDGVVFDDYFYNPEFLPEDSTASDWETYAACGLDCSIADWRRANVNATISMVSAALRDIKDGKIRFGVSPQGIGGGNGVWADYGVPLLTDYGVVTGDSQYGKIYCDPVSWLVSGDVDYISPQIYWTSDNPRHPYGGLARWWCDVAEMHGLHCWPSVTVARLANDNCPEAVAESVNQLVINREASFNNAPGSVLYSARHILGAHGRELADSLSCSLFTMPAIVPPIPRCSDPTPLEITGLHINGDHISWDAAGDSRYIVYLLPPDVDPDDAITSQSDGYHQQYIAAVTYDNSFPIDRRRLRHYVVAVAPYDRYGNEWPAKTITIK